MSNQPPIPSCAACGLFRTCHTPNIPGRGATPAEIVFVGEMPAREDDEIGEVYRGLPGQLLSLSLEAAGIPESVVWRTYALRCRAPEGKLTSPAKRTKLCSPFLLAELQAAKPKVIALLGSTAIHAVHGPGKVEHLHARLYERDGVTIVPMYSPSAVLYDESKKKDWEWDVAALRRAWVYGWQPAAPVDVVVPRTAREVEVLVQEAIARGYTAIDYETNFKRPWAVPEPRLGTFGFSLGPRRAAVVPVEHKDHVWSSSQLDDVLRALAGLLRSPWVRRIAHNAKYETLVSRVLLGIDPVFHGDTMLAHSIVRPGARHGLDFLAWEFTDLGGYSEEFESVDLPPTPHGQEPEFPGDDDALAEEEDADDPLDISRYSEGHGGQYLEVPLGRLAWYNGRDCVVTEQSDVAMDGMLTDAQKANVLPVVLDLMPVLSGMEQVGKKVDLAVVAELDGVYLQRAADLEVSMRAWPELQKAEQVLAVQRATKDLLETTKRLDEVRAELGEAVKAGDLAVAKRRDRQEDYWLEKARTIGSAIEAGAQEWHQPLNFRSVDQLKVLFFEGFGYPKTGILTKAGNDSVGKDSLMIWAEKHTAPKHFRTFRRVLTIHSGFIKPIPQLISVHGCIHASFNQQVAQTGRLTSTGPNEQNRPRGGTCDALGVPQTKSMYVSRYPGGKQINGDYSQLELRVLAVASKCEAMLTAYRIGQDLHWKTTLGMFVSLPHDGYEVLAAADPAFPVLSADRIGSLPFDLRVELAMALGKLVKEKRTVGKRCNFLTGYGGSGHRLQAVLAEEGLYLSVEECDAYIDLFFSLYPEIRVYMAGVAARAERDGGIAFAPDGRMRPVPEILSLDRGEKASAGRRAGNFAIQWIAAKLGMIALRILQDELTKRRMRTLIVGTVHDSIQLDAPAEEADDARELLRSSMEAAREHPLWVPKGWWDPSVPIVADID